MNKHIDELLARIDALQSELEEEYRKTREEWDAESKADAEKSVRTQLLLDAISAAVPVEATLPNPWAAVSAEEKARVEQETGKTFDRTLRITVALSPEQEEFVREKVKHYYENEASVRHGRVLQHFME